VAHQATLGACYHEKEFSIGEKMVKIALWDTAGQEKYSSLAQFYYHGAKAALVVFDVTQPASFERAKNWIKELNEKADEIVAIALVANKVDLSSRQVSERVLFSLDMRDFYRLRGRMLRTRNSCTSKLRLSQVPELTISLSMCLMRWPHERVAKHDWIAFCCRNRR
jgi:small GTP-binding protein